MLICSIATTVATCSIKHKQDVIEDYEIKMEESITITKKEASNQLVRNVAIIYQPALAAVSSTICSQVLVYKQSTLYHVYNI